MSTFSRSLYIRTDPSSRQWQLSGTPNKEYMGMGALEIMSKFRGWGNNFPADSGEMQQWYFTVSDPPPDRREEIDWRNDA